MTVFDGDIKDLGEHYWIKDSGPFVKKCSGRGKVLAHMLENLGEDVSLGTIEDITGWKDPSVSMSSLASIINVASDDYKISKPRSSTYRMTRMDR